MGVKKSSGGEKLSDRIKTSGQKGQGNLQFRCKMHVTGIYSVVNSFVPFSSFVDHF